MVKGTARMVSVLHISGASLGEAGSLGYQMGHSSWNSSLLEVATQASGRGGQLLAGNCGPECPYTVSSRHCDLGYLHGNSELWYPCSREPATSCIAFFHLVLEVVWQKLRSISSAVLLLSRVFTVGLNSRGGPELVSQSSGRVKELANQLAHLVNSKFPLVSQHSPTYMSVGSHRSTEFLFLSLGLD